VRVRKTRQQQHLPFVSVFAWQAEGVTVAACGRMDGWVGEDEKGRDKNSGVLSLRVDFQVINVWVIELGMLTEHHPEVDSGIPFMK
jgi:hypothetical protein